jgi:hypothetical protein
MLAVSLPNAVGRNYHVNRVVTEVRNVHDTRDEVVVLAGVAVLVVDNEVLLGMF